MNSVRVKQIIKEELRKVLKEVDWYEAEKEFKRDDTKNDYPRGGSDEDDSEFTGTPDRGEFEYSLQYGLDLPEDDSLNGHDFSNDHPYYEDDWTMGRAKTLGDEFAEKPYKDGKYLSGPAKAYWKKNKDRYL
jgi:hypothetical protein